MKEFKVIFELSVNASSKGQAKRAVQIIHDVCRPFGKVSVHRMKIEEIKS